MKDLINIINALSKEEIRFYKLFVNRTSAGKQKRKDIILFDLFRKDVNNKLTTEVIIKKLKLPNSNSYYQLKNRIYNDLNNSMTWQHISKDYQSEAYSFVLLARVYKSKDELQLSLNFLLKAEKSAVLNELYDILSIIYNEILELSHELISINIEKYLTLKEKNSVRLNSFNEIENLLAEVMYTIKIDQNFSKKRSNITKLLELKINQAKQNKDLIKTKRFNQKVFKLYSRLLLRKEDFIKLEIFLIDSFEKFEENNIYCRKNHQDKLTHLTYLTNCLNKNKKYKDSIAAAERLKLSTLEYDSFLENKFLFYYYNTLIANLFALNDFDKALNVLKKAKKNEVITKTPSFTAFIYLNYSLIYWKQKKFALASKNSSRLLLQKDFELLDNSFQLNLKIVDLIMKIHIKDFESVIVLVSNLRNSFKILLDSNKYLIENDFIQLILKISDDSIIKNDFKNFISTHNNSLKDTIIDYCEWINNYHNK